MTRGCVILNYHPFLKALDRNFIQLLLSMYGQAFVLRAHSFPLNVGVRTGCKAEYKLLLFKIMCCKYQQSSQN